MASQMDRKKKPSAWSGKEAFSARGVLALALLAYLRPLRRGDAAAPVAAPAVLVAGQGEACLVGTDGRDLRTQRVVPFARRGEAVLAARVRAKLPATHVGEPLHVGRVAKGVVHVVDAHLYQLLYYTHFLRAWGSFSQSRTKSNLDTVCVSTLTTVPSSNSTALTST